MHGRVPGAEGQVGAVQAEGRVRGRALPEAPHCCLVMGALSSIPPYPSVCCEPGKASGAPWCAGALRDASAAPRACSTVVVQ